MLLYPIALFAANTNHEIGVAKPYPDALLGHPHQPLLFSHHTSHVATTSILLLYLRQCFPTCTQPLTAVELQIPRRKAYTGLGRPCGGPATAPTASGGGRWRNNRGNIDN